MASAYLHHHVQGEELQLNRNHICQNLSTVSLPKQEYRVPDVTFLLKRGSIFQSALKTKSTVLLLKVVQLPEQGLRDDNLHARRIQGDE